MATHKAHRLVKKLAKAGQKHSEDVKERIQIAQQLLKVKRLSSKPSAKKRLREELEVLEDMMANMISLQGDLLRKEDEHDTDLKKELRDLRLKLHLIESGELEKKIERIQFILQELNARVNNYVDIKTSRDKRIEALEKRIQEQVSTNYREIMKMEKTIANLENRYNDIKSSGKYSTDQLSRVEQKIEDLRVLVLQKRKDLISKKTETLGPLKPVEKDHFLPKPMKALPKKSFGTTPPAKVAIPQGRKFPKKEFIPKDEEELPPFPQEPSRHRMLFPKPKQEKKPEFKTFNGLPLPFPPSDQEAIPTPPRPKRHRSGIMHFFRHMLHRE